MSGESSEDFRDEAARRGTTGVETMACVNFMITHELAQMFVTDLRRDGDR